MGTADKLTPAAVLGAVAKGQISRDRVDDSVYRILKSLKDSNQLNDANNMPVVGADLSGANVTSDASRKAARDIAREGMVLLENNDRVLPLDFSQLLEEGEVDALGGKGESKNKTVEFHLYNCRLERTSKSVNVKLK